VNEITALQVAVVRNCIEAKEVEIERLQKRIEQLHACLAELQPEPELQLLHSEKRTA
jgi:hypothetical protein